MALIAFSYSDSSSYYKNMFISEMYYSSWAEHYKREIWEPNNKVFDRFVARGWYGRFISVPGFQPLRNIFEAELATVGAPLLLSKPLKIDCLSEPLKESYYAKLYSVYAVYIPICPFQKLIYSNHFLFTEYSIKVFFASYSTSSLLLDRESEVAIVHIELWRKNISVFVSNSTAIKYRLKQKFQHSLNLDKKCAEKYFLTNIDTVYVSSKIY